MKICRPRPFYDNNVNEAAAKECSKDTKPIKRVEHRYRFRGERVAVFQKFRAFLAPKAYVLFSIIGFASVVGIGYALIKLDRDNHMSAVRLDVEQALYTATDQIRLRFFEAELVGNKIESALSVSDGIPEKKIGRIVKDLQAHIPGVLAVALAPNLQVTHSFPQSDNSSAIGLKYWEVPEQLASVARAYRTRTPVVDGPVPLIQGGSGYILRYPVFLQVDERNSESFWGVISIVVDAEGLLKAHQHDIGDAANYVFNLREIKVNEAVPPDLHGAVELHKNQPVTTQFAMFGSKWQATALPAGGWPSYSPQSPYLLGFALVAALLLVGVLWMYRSLAVKQRNAHALLAESIDCINEGFIAFDERERLVIVNQKYLDYHPALADRVVPGMAMNELLKLEVAHGHYPEAAGQEADWIAKRLAQFRHPQEPFLQVIDEQRWLKVTEARTPHGYTVGIRTDVTAEKRAQEAAEATDREKTEFLNNVSHELRTPLTVISGRAAFLRNSEKMLQSRRVKMALESEDATKEELVLAVNTHQSFVSEQGAKIAESAKHMLRLVEDLLDWTKVARGQLELDMAVAEVGGIAASVAEDLRPDADAKGLTLTYSADGEAEALVDAIRLKQILYNLISNAVKFTDKGSIHLSMAQENEQISFSITDTGCGIPKCDLERIFQRFQQVDGSMSRQNGGLGLGLAIADQLTSLHNGKLSVESIQGKGSTFRLSLPRLDPAMVLQKTG